MHTPFFLFACVAVVGNYQQLFAFNVFQASEPTDPNDYGVDISFPIHHYIDKSRSPIGHQRYQDMMKGCYEKYSKRECDGTERARMDMNMAQPGSQHNYTEIGFKKLKAPPAAWAPLIAFYEANKNNLKPENWPRGNTYVNSWDSPTYMVSLENPELRGGLNVKQQIWAGVKPILEEWTGHKLEPTSLYGIRVYKDGAMLSTRKHYLR
jgi:prolyl 4-hydroxylase